MIDSNVGADAWRRTGVLTFDGNLRVSNKVTYERKALKCQILGAAVHVIVLVC